MNDISFELKPHKPSGGEIGIKLITGFFIGFFVTAIIVFVLVLMGGMFDAAISSKSAGSSSTINPMLPLVIIIISFIATVLGNIAMTGAYSFLMSDKYYDFGKMIKVVLVNIFVLLILFAPLYLLFYSKIEVVFLILAFHIIFSVYLTLNSLEFISNPNYCLSHILGTSVGFLVSLLILGVIFKVVNIEYEYAKNIFIGAPAFLAYLVIPLVHLIWENINYSFYENGSTTFYAPSIDEIMVEEEDTQEPNIEVE